MTRTSTAFVTALRAAALLCLLLPNLVRAGVYMDLGLGQMRDMEVVKDNAVADLPGPIGKYEIGYKYATRYGEISASWLHLSSVATGSDKGLDWGGISYRLTGDDVREMYRDLVR